MKYSKLNSIIRDSAPSDKSPRLTEEQIEKLKTAGSVALAIVGAAGAVALSVVAPNMFMALDKIFGKKSNRRVGKKEKAERIARTFYYLKRHNYIILKPAGRDLKIFLTKLGKNRLKYLNFETLTITHPKKWNGKWWQIAADIPTKKYKWAADAFRQKLLEMKFYPLQRTLWFFPFDPRNELEFIINRFHIGSFVTVMEVSRLDFADEEIMLEFFKREKILDS